MKLPKMKTHLAGAIWSQHLEKVFFCIAFFFSFSLFYSCSGDDQTDPEPDTSTPYSVTIGNQNENMPTGGIITSQYSDSPSGSDIGKAADNNADTKFITNHDEFYIMWAGSENMAINYYSLTSTSDSPEKDPKSWTLLASNDKNEWVVLDTQTGQAFSNRKEKKEYPFDNNTGYKYYKLNVLANNGGTSTQIAEWTMRVVIDPLVPYSVTIADNNKNMPTGGIITSEFSDFPSGSDISKIADNNAYTKFVTNHREFYIKWQGNASTTVNYYSLTSADDAPEKDPKSWTLKASNDKIIWFTLDKQEDQTFEARREIKEYEFDNKTAYKYYELYIKDNNGDAATQIAEWTMEEIPTNIEALMKYSNGDTHSSQTAMGKFFEGRHVTTEADRIWLADATKEPELPQSDDRHLAAFTVNLYPYGEPVPADVNQHGIGNCSAVAVFASFAYIYPDFIKSIIKDNGDATYTVSMFDPQGNPLKVSIASKFLADQNGNIIAGTGKNNIPTWSTVLEMAMIKYNAIYKINGNYDLGGIGTEHAAPLFTGDGDSFAFSPGALTASQLAQVVKVCLRQGKIVIGGFNKADLSLDGSKTVTGHAYTFMHSANKEALFIMRNPWGGNPDVDGSKDGVLNVPDNGVIAPTIDLRIVEPGKAAQTGTGVKHPYIPPALKAGEAKMRVADYLLRPSVRR